MVESEVDKRLNSSVYNAALINLGKENQPQQIKRPWDVEVKLGNQPSEPLPQEERIIDFFDREAIAGKFLILGTPGSGKTTTLLELARELVNRSKNDANQPIPVLFNLSRKDDRQSIAQWLVTELKDKYGVRKDIGQNCLNEHDLLPLLDGLDELEPIRQEKCIRSINQFLESEKRPLYLVVCSRLEEYQLSKTKLQLNGAIYLQPLTGAQIQEYLVFLELKDLWKIVKGDFNILGLIKIPLFLNLIILLYRDNQNLIKQWQENTRETLVKKLLDSYVTQMLQRNMKSKTYSGRNEPTKKKTVEWLTYLARTLMAESRTEFSSDKIQLSWLPKYWRGEKPWNYRYFLDYATERMLLERVGTRYRFIHRLLQEYFAQLPLPQE
jgi:predicted NACHT family NTPase